MDELMEGETCSEEEEEESEAKMTSESESGTGQKKKAAALTNSSKKKKQKKRKPLGVNTSCCKYESVRRVMKRFGMKECRDDEDSVLYWMDTSAPMERVVELKRFQKINHFPGMTEICRKDFLARNMNRMLKLFPKDYNFTPRTWCLPADYGDLLSFCCQNSKKNKLFISKPPSGSQGKGIFITRNPKDLKSSEHVVVQQYLAKPFTIDGFKMDFRIYVLVTQCDPLHVFVYKDGLGRFATHKYSEPTAANMDDVYLHLTNYSLNKFSDEFVRDEDCGSKRRITTVNKWMEENGYNIKKMWAGIEDIIIKTLISIHPILKHNYRTCFSSHTRGSACFEILGFDVMLDKKLKPWLLEVNLSPSLHTDAPLDKDIKEGFVWDTLHLINLNGDDKRRCQEEDRKKVQERLFQRSKATREAKKEEMQESQQKYEEWLRKYEEKNLGGFRRIYPKDGNEEHYEKFYTDSASLFSETAASKARQLCVKLQREQIESKQRELEQCRTRGNGRVENKAKESQLQQPRPESPRMMKRIRQKNPTRRVPPEKSSLISLLKSASDMTERCRKEPDIDTTLPMDINETEENYRLSELEQRTMLIKGLGLIEYVVKMFHGSTGCAPFESQKKSARMIGVSFSELYSHPGFPLPRQRPDHVVSSLLPSRKTVGAGHGLGSNWTQYRLQGRQKESETLAQFSASGGVGSAEVGYHTAWVANKTAVPGKKAVSSKDGVDLQLTGHSTVALFQQQMKPCGRLPLKSQAVPHHQAPAQKQSLTVIGSSKISLTARSLHYRHPKAVAAAKLLIPGQQETVPC
eukprot:m.308210 g.308210  ORF g.308210 m.308210 type:complete len:803 (+) comp43571_c0_seq1:76-2484(+)